MVRLQKNFGGVVMMTDTEWKALKDKELMGMFADLSRRVKLVEDKLFALECVVKNHATMGDFCPHTGKGVE